MSKATMPRDNADETPDGDRDDTVQTPSEIDTISELIDTLGGTSATVVVNRVGIGKRDYLTELAVSDFDMEWLANEYGGGEYFLQFKDSNRRFVRGLTVRVDASRKPRHTPVAAPTPEPARVDPALAALLEQNKAIMEELKALRAEPVQAKDPTEQLVTLSTIVKNLQQPQPAHDATMAATLAELRAELRELREKQSGGGLLEQLTTLQKIWEVKPEASGGSDDEGGILGGLAKILHSPVAQLAAQKMFSGATAQQPPTGGEPHALLAESTASASVDASPGATAAVPPAPSVAPSSPSGIPADALNFVFEAASQNVPVSEFTELLQGNMTVKAYDALIDALDGDDWRTAVFGTDPRAVTHAAWLANLRAYMLTADDADDAEEEIAPVAAPGRNEKPKPGPNVHKKQAAHY